MKDYTIMIPLGDECGDQKENFILRYNINEKDNLIEVYYANHHMETIAYSVDNELELLKKMKQQVIDYRDFIINAEKIKKEEEEEKRKIVIMLTGMMILGWGFVFSDYIKNKNFILSYTVLRTIISGIAVHNQVRDKMLFDDFNKNLLFLENEDIINERKICEKGEKQITINSIDKMSLKRLRKILEDNLVFENSEDIKLKRK